MKFWFQTLLQWLRVNKYSLNCCPSTPPPLDASTRKLLFKSLWNTWTELSLQNPFSGNLITYRLSKLNPEFLESIKAEQSSGKTSSIKCFSALSEILSPRSGFMETAMQSQNSRPLPPVHATESGFSFLILFTFRTISRWWTNPWRS